MKISRKYADIINREFWKRLNETRESEHIKNRIVQQLTRSESTPRLSARSTNKRGRKRKQ